MIIIRVSLDLVIFLSNQDGNHDGYTTFNQSGNNFNNQNDKRGKNTTFNQGGTVMNNQNDLIIGDEYKCLAMTINYWR